MNDERRPAHDDVANRAGHRERNDRGFEHPLPRIRRERTDLRVLVPPPAADRVACHGAGGGARGIQVRCGGDRELHRSSRRRDLRTVLRERTGSPAEGRAILVDNTSDPQLAGQYPVFLRQGISIVTPNKKGFSSDLALWKEIFAAAESAGGVTHYLIEQEGSRFPSIETAQRCLASYKAMRG